MKWEKVKELIEEAYYQKEACVKKSCFEDYSSEVKEQAALRGHERRDLWHVTALSNVDRVAAFNIIIATAKNMIITGMIQMTWSDTAARFC